MHGTQQKATLPVPPGVNVWNHSHSVCSPNNGVQLQRKTCSGYTVAQLDHWQGSLKEGWGLFELNFTSYKKSFRSGDSQLLGYNCVVRWESNRCFVGT
jgi:hypothetical protein